MGTDTDQTSEQTQEVAVQPDVKVEAPSQTEESPKQEVSSAPAPEAKSYTPDYKLKVYDEEKELDDPFLKALIKDADSEKKVKEIAQKYLGFDTVKGRHEKTKTEYQAYQQQTQPIVEYYNKATKLLQGGDLDSFFDLLKIPTNAIFQYAVQKAEEANLSPEQRYALHQQRQDRMMKMQLEEQNQSLMTQQQRQLTEFRNQELNWVLARPEVHSVVQSIDQKYGPGTFRKAVIEKGLAHHAATQGKEDLSAEQAVQEVMKLLGGVVTPTPPAQAQPGAPASLIQQNGQPPVIPNVTSRGGSSPVKKQVRSIADLKKKSEELRSSS